jgi:hypothetical protein
MPFKKGEVANPRNRRRKTKTVTVTVGPEHSGKSVIVELTIKGRRVWIEVPPDGGIVKL